MVRLIKNRILPFLFSFGAVFFALTPSVSAAQQVNCEAALAACLLIGANVPMCSVFYTLCKIFGP